MQSTHALPSHVSLMEFIIVRIAAEPTAEVDVLINGEKNGITGSLLTLGKPGSVFVSVDRPTARERKIYVQGTTVARPMEVDIDA